MKSQRFEIVVRLLVSIFIVNGIIAKEIPKSHFGIAHNPFAYFANNKQEQKQNLKETLLSNNSNLSSNTNVLVRIRGGGCSDSNPILFIKIGLSAVLETGLMTSLILFSQNVTAKYPERSVNIFGLPAITWLSLLAVIFASSFFGSIVDGGLSAATRQVLDPNAVAGDADWYENLIKPSWNPPGWLFPIMWLIVSKPTQLIAVSMLLKGDSKFIPWLLLMYCAHLSLGDAWNKVFFGLQCPGRGAAVISVFWAVLVLSAILFYNIDETAGKYMLPSCAWVTVASALNWNIYLNNK